MIDSICLKNSLETTGLISRSLFPFIFLMSKVNSFQFQMEEKSICSFLVFFEGKDKVVEGGGGCVCVCVWGGGGRFFFLLHFLRHTLLAGFGGISQRSGMKNAGRLSFRFYPLLLKPTF